MELNHGIIKEKECEERVLENMQTWKHPVPEHQRSTIFFILKLCLLVDNPGKTKIFKDILYVTPILPSTCDFSKRLYKMSTSKKKKTVAFMGGVNENEYETEVSPEEVQRREGKLEPHRRSRDAPELLKNTNARYRNYI